ncbi:MAG: WXG100 family type VII secretion target [Micromonosporaceae bacterium]
MTGPGFKSDAAAMTRAVSGFDDTATQASQTMVQLENELMSVLTRYSGNQANAFWRLHGRIHENMQVATRELQTMSDLVGKSFKNYDTGDWTVADSLSTLSNTVDADGATLRRLGGN